jgi:hypothetical protein
MNNLRRGCLGILVVLITVTLSACSERQARATNNASRPEGARVSGGESRGKPVEAPKAKPRIVPKKKIVEDEVNFPPPRAKEGD